VQFYQSVQNWTLWLAGSCHAMRKAIRRTLEQEPRIEIVAEASTFPEAVQKISEFKPAVLLLDLHPPEEREFT
jgi:chemotaxis response regulator CheB